jgi:hypothetical protein
MIAELQHPDSRSEGTEAQRGLVAIGPTPGEPDDLCSLGFY